MRLLGFTVLVFIVTGTLAKASEPSEAFSNGFSWRQAFPEHERFGGFAPAYAANFIGGSVTSPEFLIQSWHRLPNELRQWECGKDGLGYDKRCLDQTFNGSEEYVGQSVTAHFDTIKGLWHFIGFEVH